MNYDTLKGTGTEVLGRAKEFAGRQTGDFKTSAEGYIDEASGIARRNYGHARDALSDATSQGSAALVRQVEDQPVASLLVAAAIGFVVGWAVRR